MRFRALWALSERAATAANEKYLGNAEFARAISSCPHLLAHALKQAWTAGFTLPEEERLKALAAWMLDIGDDTEERPEIRMWAPIAAASLATWLRSDDLRSRSASALFDIIELNPPFADEFLALAEMLAGGMEKPPPELQARIEISRKRLDEEASDTDQ